jgi:hypothetical protein
MIVGDFSAQVGNYRTGYVEVMGHFAECCRNNEGRDLLDTCITNVCVTGSGRFEMGLSHELTRYRWGRVWRSIIDYIIMTKVSKHTYFP